MTTYCILGTGGVVETTFANSQLPTSQAGYTEIAVSGGQVGQIWNGSAFVASVTAAQAAQIATLQAAYQAAIEAPVTYITKAGVSKQYSATPDAVANLEDCMLAFQLAGATPTGFYFIATDGTQVPFAYADLQGLSAAFGIPGAAAFAQLQTLTAQVNAATTVAAVQAIVW
jgi:hypothetical protein